MERTLDLDSEPWFKSMIVPDDESLVQRTGDEALNLRHLHQVNDLLSMRIVL